jgi:GNAT superfamily N-acetyltransferase
MTDPLRYRDSAGDVDEKQAGEFTAELIRRVRAFNFERVGEYRFAPLAAVAHDADGELVGGAGGTIGLRWLHVDVMWVAESQRGRDLGSRLLARLEALAIERGARRAHVETTSFQALDFYRKHGYEVFGQLEDFPEGHTYFYLKKTFPGAADES